GQLIWRYHPERRAYEVFGEGGGNTFGVEIDAQGRTFSGTNGGNSRGYHYVQGGYARKGFGKHGALSNPYAFGYFAAMKHNKVPRFTHNFVIYEGGVLPQRYHGQLFGIEPLQGQVVLSDVTRDGSTFQTRDLFRPVRTDDQWFRPVDIKLGPDGGIYIADLYEQRIDHSSHFAGRVTRNSGRVYRLTHPSKPRLEAFDYGRLDSRALVAVLKHPNRWHRQQALRLLGDRRDQSLIPVLNELVRTADEPLALEYLWALNLSGGLNEQRAGSLLRHRDPGVRAWTVRLMCDDHRVGDAFAGHMAEMALNEGYVDVRSQLACSARRLPAGQAMAILKGLVTHDEDVADPHLPLLLWWVLEAQAERDREQVLKFFSDPQIWELALVKKFLVERVIKRYAMAGSRLDLLTCARLLNAAPDRKQSGLLMKSFEQAFQGRSLVDLPTELVAAINKAGGASLALQVRQGESAAIMKALRAVANPQVDLQERLNLIQVFGEIRLPACEPVLLKLLQSNQDSRLTRGVLSALGAFDDGRIAEIVLQRVPTLKPDERRAAEVLLSSRRAWGRKFMDAVEQGKLPRTEVSQAAIRRMLLHDDPGLKARVRKIWGDIQGETTEEMRARIRDLSDVIDDGSGNPYQGRSLFR
ncbi:MAG: HEAT repeat domain-containing protein, partial [Planctomycetaceae bacterium]